MKQNKKNDAATGERMSREEALKKLIIEYKKKIEGFREINKLLESILYILLSEKGETLIPKKSVSDGIGKYSCQVNDTGDAYRILTSRLPEDAAENEEEATDAAEQI